LVWALRRWVALDHPVRVVQGGLRGVQAEVAFAATGARPLIVPKTRVTVAASVTEVGAVAEALMRGEPSVAVSVEPQIRALWLNPQHLEAGQEEIVAARVRQILEQAMRS
jgi:hypothetical protein